MALDQLATASEKFVADCIKNGAKPHPADELREKKLLELSTKEPEEPKKKKTRKSKKSEEEPQEPKQSEPAEFEQSQEEIPQTASQKRRKHHRKSQ